MVLTIKLKPETMEVNAAHKVTRSEDIMRMTLGSAMISQMNGWRKEEHPLCNNSPLFPDQRNEWIAVRAEDKGQKTPTETMALGVERRCIRLIAIRKPDHRIKETGPTSRQG